MIHKLHFFINRSLPLPKNDARLSLQIFSYFCATNSMHTRLCLPLPIYTPSTAKALVVSLFGNRRKLHFQFPTPLRMRKIGLLFLFVGLWMVASPLAAAQTRREAGYVISDADLAKLRERISREKGKKSSN
jgi:hypothetical protein